MPSPRRSGGTQTPCTWAADGGARDLRLEDQATVVEAREGPAAGDQLADPRSVQLPATARLRRDPDLLGVHRHAGRIDLRQVVHRRDPHPRVGLGLRLLGDLQVGLFTDLPGRPQVPATPSQRVRTADCGPTIVETLRPRVRARSAKTRASSSVACTGTRFAPTWQAAVSLPSRKRPRPRHQPSGLQVGGAGAVVGEHVDHGVCATSRTKSEDPRGREPGHRDGS